MINRSSQGILWSASIHPSHPAIQMGADAGSLWQRTILSMAPPTLTTYIKSMGFESTHLSSYRTFPWPLVVEQMWRSSRSHPCLERSLTCILPIGLSERGKYHHKPHGLQTPRKQLPLERKMEYPFLRYGWTDRRRLVTPSFTVHLSRH